MTTPTPFPLSPTAERYDTIARALDNLPSTTPAQHRADIFEAIIHPTLGPWRTARLLRVSEPSPNHPRGLTLWRLMMLVYSPTPEQSITIPSGALIVHALNRVHQYR